MAIQKVTNIAIDTGAVTGTSLLDGTIQTADIADGAITTAKINASFTPTITGGTLNGVTIGQVTPGAGTFSTLAITGNASVNNTSVTGTWTNLGTVTTVDINGGTIDGAVIGANSAAAATFTSATISGTVPVIILSDTGAPATNMISADNATGSLELRADNTNILGSSSITQYIDGGLITTTNASGQSTTGNITASGFVSGNTVRVNGNILSATAGTATVTVPNATTTLVGTDLTQTLTNKTITGGILLGTTQVGGEVTNTATSALQVAVGTIAERPTGAAGKIRYNTDTQQYEGYNAGSSTWTSIGGGATGGTNNPIFYENDTTVTQNYTVTAGKNAMTAGPVEVNSGVIVTVNSGSCWTVV